MGPTSVAALTSPWRRAGIESIADIRHTHEGIEAHFAAFRRPLSGISLSLFGLVFTCIGLGVALWGDGPFLGLVFTLLGLLLTSLGIYSLGKSLHVSVGPGGVRTRRYLFGYPLKTRRISTAELLALEIEQSGSMQTGHRTTLFYTLEARARNDVSLTVAERLESRSEAELIQESFNTYLGICNNPD